MTKINVTALKYSNVANDDTTKGTIIDIISFVKHGLKSKYQKYEKIWLPALQNTNCGWRVQTRNEEYFSKYWDGLVFVDVDHLVDDPDTYLARMHEELSRYSFYLGGQLSYSKNGFHLVFYIPKKEGTVEEYYRYAAYIYTLIFKDLIPKDCFDWHNFQHHQVLKLTTHKWYVNDKFEIKDVNIDRKDIDNFFWSYGNHFIEMYKQDLTKIKRDKLNSERYSYSKIEKREDDKPFFYFEHSDRWKLFMTLMYIYNEDEKLVYDTACEIMRYSYTDKHSYSELCNFFDPNSTSMDWYKKYIPDERYNLDKIEFLKEYFGINLNDKNDVHLTMDDGKYLLDYSDSILKYIKPGFNMMVVPTGGGKTTFWDMLRMNSITIEPYNSVVNDKFEDTYKAVGSGNKVDINEEYQITNYWKFIDFVNRENKFYEYIIVDESHIIGTQPFRNSKENGHTLIDFINALNDYHTMYPESKIILQTATPSNETYLFNIDNFITIDKKLNKYVQIIYDMSENLKSEKDGIKEYEFNLKHNILSKVESLHNEGRKIYIYYGSGGINFMKSMRSLVKLLKGYKVAIYHKKNENNYDIEEIREKKCIGDYDILISSCYFSVGCDLNDEKSAGIIIIGNNTYQEDDQVIGRFRKSKNIKVYVLLDKICNIKKIDVSKLLMKEKNKIRLQNEIHNIRNNTLINRICNENNVDMYSFIKCSHDYYCDLVRKFEFYDQRGYDTPNYIDKYFDKYKEEWYYDICEKLYGMSVVNYIDEDYENINKLDNAYYVSEKEYKDKIYDDLLNNRITDFKKLRKELIDRPKMQDWIRIIEVFAKYYDLDYILHNVSERSIKSITYDKCKSLLQYVMKMKEDKLDAVEHMLISDLIDKYDNNKDIKDEIEIWIVLYYCLWVNGSSSNVQHMYDLNQKNVFTLFNTWRRTILDILNVNKSIRNYLIDCNKNDIDFVKTSIPEFIKDIYNKESVFEKIEYYINNVMYADYIGKFIRYKLKKLDIENIKTKEKLNIEYNKIGGKINGKTIQITTEFNKPEKYNLNIGQTFSSCTELAKFTNKNKNTISKWIKKGWITKI